MNSIVRRVGSIPAVHDSNDLLAARSHRSWGIAVTSQVALGIQPKLLLSWNVTPVYWEKGYTLLVFHSGSGFSAEKYPDDLNAHGQLIIDTHEDACYDEHPPEGTHFYTFILHKKHLLGLSESMSIVRFSETIPSAKVGIGRIKDQIDLQRMLQQHEVDAIEHESKLNEAELRRHHSRKLLEDVQNTKDEKKMSSTEKRIAEELADIDALVETIIAKKKKIDSLKRDNRFVGLSKKEQRAVIEKIKERLDAGEINAHHDLH